LYRVKQLDVFVRGEVALELAWRVQDRLHRPLRLWLDERRYRRLRRSGRGGNCSLRHWRYQKHKIASLSYLFQVLSLFAWSVEDPGASWQMSFSARK
jgi:hypothetical protein